MGDRTLMVYPGHPWGHEVADPCKDVRYVFSYEGGAWWITAMTKRRRVLLPCNPAHVLGPAIR